MGTADYDGLCDERNETEMKKSKLFGYFLSKLLSKD
jgi:hypothetical protein